MIIRRFITLCAGLAPVLFLLGCAFNWDLASGTGVGNPTGITKVSIIADKGYGTSTQDLQPVIQEEIPVMDDGGLLFTVTAISINVHYFKFIESNIDEKRQQLISDKPADGQATDIQLDGPFLFDAMSGLPTPSIDSFALPAGKYGEVRLFIKNKGDQSSPYAFEISGHFEYNGKKRDFFFKLQRNELASYKYKGPAFKITEEDSTLFTLVLNAERWLESVNIGESLENNEITLNQTGDLVIDNSTVGKPYEKLKRSISQSIIKSGFLLITPLN
jgi:hypothetical protein